MAKRKKPIKSTQAAKTKTQPAKQDVRAMSRQTARDAKSSSPAAAPSPPKAKPSKAAEAIPRQVSAPAPTKSPEATAPKKPASLAAAKPAAAAEAKAKPRAAAGTAISPSASRPGENDASHAFQSFISDMRRMASDTIEQTTGAMEQLRGAKNMEEVVSLQTAFMQQSLQRYTLFAQRIGQLMVASQANLIRQEVDLFQQGHAAMRSIGSIAGKS